MFTKKVSIAFLLRLDSNFLSYFHFYQSGTCISFSVNPQNKPVDNEARAKMIVVVDQLIVDQQKNKWASKNTKHSLVPASQL